MIYHELYIIEFIINISLLIIIINYQLINNSDTSANEYGFV